MSGYSFCELAAWSGERKWQKESEMAKRRVNAKSNVTASLRSIVKYFELLPDPRHERYRRHRLKDIIIISVCGVIVGCEGPASIHAWAKAKEAWLKRFLELRHSVARLYSSRSDGAET